MTRLTGYYALLQDSLPTLYGKKAATESKLKVALLTGVATTEIHADIAAIERRIHELSQIEAKATAAAEDARIDRLFQSAALTAAQITSRLEAVLGDISIPPETPMENLMQHPDILQAAAQLETATTDLTEARLIADVAGTASDKITGQISSLSARRATIAARRAGGDHEPSDGAKLAEIGADLEGLAALSVDAGRKAGEARHDANDKASARNQAAKALSDAEDHVLTEALIERAKAIDAVLLDTVGKLATVTARQRVRAPWVASPPLLRALNKLASERPDLATHGQPGSRWPALRTVG